jgi:probable selenate reductase FAD-binding subunit
MPTGFHRPTTVSEALSLQARLAPGATFLAGGTELNQKHCPAPPSHLISLAELDLGGIAVGPGRVVLGATLSFQELLDSTEAPAPLGRAAARLVNRNVRNAATVGGQLATAKSCADLIPCLVAMGAKVLLSTLDGSGAIPVAEYVIAKPEGLIVGIEIPWPGDGRGVGLANFTRTANDLSVITAAASMARSGEDVVAPILAIGGVAPSVVRLPEVERALEGGALPPRADLEALVASAVSPIDDLRGSAAFKRQLASQLAADVLDEAYRAAEVRT